MPLRAENNRVHDAPRQQREQARNDQRAGEQPDHRAAMRDHLMGVRAPDRERQHDKHEDGQQVDRAPGTEQTNLVDPERLGIAGRASPR